MGKNFEIKYHSKVPHQDLKKLTKAIQIQLRVAIENKLQSNPIGFGKPLTGILKKYFSIRVGNYRIVYVVKGSIVTILVCEHRSTVYKEAMNRLF